MKKFRIFALPFISIVFLNCTRVKELPSFTQSNDKVQKIAFIGDTGVDGIQQQTIGKALEQEGIQGLVILGDIIYPNGLGSVNDPQLFTKFINHYGGLIQQGVTMYLIEGNHDNRTGGKNPFLELHGQAGIYYPQSNWAINLSNVCLFAFDPRMNPESSAEFLKSTISEYDTCKFKIAFSHYPLRSSGMHGVAREPERSVIKDYVLGKFDAYIAGHDHNLSYENQIDGTHLFVSGAGGQVRPLRKGLKLKEGRWAASKLGYLLMTIQPETLLFEFKDEKNNLLKEILVPLK